MTYDINSLIDFKTHETIPWLKDSLLFLTVHGSRAYGLATPESDLDIKGFCCPPKEYFLSPFKTFEQALGKSKECEYVIYDIRKFISLAADCNPNIIEVLWADDEDIIFMDKFGKLLRDNKEAFLSSKAKHTFSGYAIAQLNRIKTHKRWLLNPPSEPPTREDLGLPSYDEISRAKLEALLADIKKKVDQWNIGLDELPMSERVRIEEQISLTLAEMKIGKDERWNAAAKILCLSENVIEILDKERHYRNLVNQWEQYLNWKNSRNEKRAALEEKYGYDTKHASHLVRLMRMCEEILTKGQVIVKRPDRDYILEVRAGQWTYDQLLIFADEQDKKLNELYKTTKLKHKPDKAFLEKLCIDIVSGKLNLNSSEYHEHFKLSK